MNEMKYVVVETEEQGKQMFIFPKNIDHDSFAEVLSNIRYLVNGDPRNWKRIYREVVSAGFTDRNVCYGWSETLDIGAAVTDTALMKNGGV
jgi:hypothetical protein